MTPTQAQLDFGIPVYTAESFLNSDETAHARAALQHWRTWPGGVLCLHGEAGSGKSHLGAIWAGEAGAVSLRGPDLSLAFVESPKPDDRLTALIDDADQADETALFALLTRLERDGGAVLLLARQAPSLWPYHLADLRSRLRAVPHECLRPPEVPLLAQLIVRHAAAQGYRLDAASSTYLAERIPRTFEAAKAVTDRLQTVATYSLKSPMALAQRALRAYYPDAWHEADEPDTGDLFEA
ncbi:hypothetical protein PbB2_00775 [Candidatus Phycosocius bacilliformis]|uniref:DnaA regulatory inactivator Hda n=1 Tax=Candidatus Phycosocius bacilliformis TaxID=1445552 RepID=A0A2P2E7S1_9PROT|nr:hypothetical protein PbB2_00775 [Candidatus Phycosocius bacilliformis]